MPRPKPESPQDFLKAYPRVCAAVIAHSLGYATPSTAASIVRSAARRESHYCEWIACCYSCNPLPAVQRAIQNRHGLKGYMADYQQALPIVRRAIQFGDEPMFASWF